MKLNLAISPCPNDTFAFYHFLHDREQTSFILEHEFADIQQLNEGAGATKWDIVKASFAAFPAFEKDYALLPCGGALGYGVGPVLIGKKDSDFNQNSKIGIPGRNTTANLLYRFYLESEGIQDSPVGQFMTFSDILPALQNNQLNFGVLIHEGRFVYQNFGFQLVNDLGDYWEKQTGFPVPLGGIFIRKDLPKDIKSLIAKKISQSVEYGFDVYSNNKEKFTREMLPFIAAHGQELDRETLLSHIFTYVNEDTVALTENGKRAVEFFLDYARNKSRIPYESSTI